MFSTPLKSPNNDLSYHAFIRKLNMPLMEEHKKEAATKAPEPFTLFEREKLQNYVNSIETCQENFLLQKDSEAAERVYLQLIQDHPGYPDAYIQVADLYSKNKDHRNAIDFYDVAIGLCPFDLKLKMLHTIQCMCLKTSDPNSAYKNVDLTSVLKEIREEIEVEKAKEIDFRTWYHFTIVKILKRHDYTVGELCEKIKKVFPDVYKGQQAQKEHKYEMASYFSKKAILKFEDDFLSINQCALNHHFMGEDEKALVELNKILRKYKNPQTLLAIFAVYFNTQQYDKAKEAILAGIQICDKADTLALKQSQEDILRLINDIEVITRSFSLGNFSNSWEKIIAKRSSIEKGNTNKKCDGEIEMLTSMIKTSPSIADYYFQRAFFYLHKGLAELAKLDYSVTLWLGFIEAAPDAYVGRAFANLMLGKTGYAQIDLDNALQILTQDSNKAALALVLANVSKECIRIGNLHLKNGDIHLAEKIFVFGILKSPSAELYMQYAKVLGMQDRYVEALDALKHARQSTIGLTTSALREIDDMAKQLATKNKTLGQKLESKASDIETKSPGPVVEIQKKQKKNKKPNPVRILNQKPKKRGTNTAMIKSLLLEETVELEINSLLIEETVKLELPSEEKEMKSASPEIIKPKKKKNKRNNVKSRRSKVREQASEISETESDDTPISTPTSAVSPSLTEPTLTPTPTTTEPKHFKLELSDQEKNIFEMINSCKAEHPNQTFNTYITGGWAFDRVKNELFNTPAPKHCKDIDTVTDIPFETLKKRFPHFLAIPQVKGLLRGTINGTQVDIISRDKLDLKSDALSRHFLALYFDDNGVVYDPTNTAIEDTRQGILRCTSPVDEVFQQDPLSILRVIYLSTKRPLTMHESLVNQIPLDKNLLVPRAYPNQNDENMPLHPYRFNTTLKKLFSQGHTLTNYDRLRELGLLKVLFPEVSPYLEKDNAWMHEQMQSANWCTWPKLEIIYCNMIVCAVMNEAREKLPANASTEIESNFIREASARIFNNSLLFENRFTTVDNMHQYLRKSIAEWKIHQNNKLNQVVTEETPRPRMS